MCIYHEIARNSYPTLHLLEHKLRPDGDMIFTNTWIKGVHPSQTHSGSRHIGGRSLGFLVLGKLLWIDWSSLGTKSHGTCNPDEDAGAKGATDASAPMNRDQSHGFLESKTNLPGFKMFLGFITSGHASSCDVFTLSCDPCPF